MKLLRGKVDEEIPDFAGGSVATIGNFDGVHLGHQALLQALASKAKVLNLPSVVLLFEPQPNEFFKGSDAPARLTTLREKCDIFPHSQIDTVYCLRFQKKLAELPACLFAEKYLFSLLNAKYLLIGADFRFGFQRQGDVVLLEDMAQSHDCTLEIFPDFIKDEKRISSTKIREALAKGYLDQAEKMLGRPYSLCGRVMRGDGRGRSVFGAPTANLAVNRARLPLSGVFVVEVCIFGENKGHYGVANLGCRPTLDGQKNSLEVHLFDYNGNLYGKRLQVFFLQKLRDEIKFSSLDALRDQIHADIAAAKHTLIRVEHHD